MMFLGIAYFSVLYVSSSLGAETCNPIQYLELGLKGVIECSFKEDFYGVVWYNSENFVHEESIVRYFDDEKQGSGYVSGEFDISLNGALIIKNVSLSHDHTFAVMKFDSQDDNPVPIVVKIVVTVKPSMPFPMIDKCGSGKSCFVRLDQMSQITCVVQRARPAVRLSWVTRTAFGDKNITSNRTLREENEAFTSSAITSNPFYYNSLLGFLVCQAENHTGTLSKGEAFIMIERKYELFSSTTPINIFIERGSKLELSCLNTSDSLIVWRKSHGYGETFELLSYTAVFNENFTELLSEEYLLTKDGNLILENAEIKHEGYYGCVSDGMDTTDIKLFHVLVYVIEKPRIEGCPRQQQHCILQKSDEGILTCSVNGVRPVVVLDFKAFSQEESSVISFYNRQVNTIDTGQVYMTRITSHYRIKDAATTQLKIKCTMSETNIESLNINAVFILSIEREQTTDDTEESEGPRPLWRILVALIPFIVIGTCGVLFLLLRVKGRGKSNVQSKGKTEQEESTAMLPQKEIGGKAHVTHMDESASEQTTVDLHRARKEDTTALKYQSEKLSDNLSTFIGQLKQKYWNLCHEVRPVPFRREGTCVDSIFIQGGFQYLVKGVGTHQQWKNLSSCIEIFTKDSLISKRRVIEGEAGYGKSIFALQMAYDWCEDKIPLNKVKIFILLRLRQMGGIISFYSAIKRFLLPADSSLTEKDVEQLIKTYAESTLIILEGYDEYPEIKSCANPDIEGILKQRILSECEVIVTSRSSCLPKNIAAAAKQFKLTGFDAASRDKYLQKVILKTYPGKTTELIRINLQEDPVLHDVCQVPLFFVMYVHMSHDPHEAVKFHCVTRFFRNVVWCFHSHMKNKQQDENVQKCASYENDHKKLDKVAFEGLTGPNEKLTWQKETLCKELGQKFYEEYVRVGILVEEEITVFHDNPGEHANDSIQCRTEVRFFHKLFCEWYAAHYLSDYASTNDFTLTKSSRSHQTHELRSTKPIGNASDELSDSPTDASDHFLERMSPTANEYVYRFACGLNRTAGNKIIKYLESIDDGEKFVILCILEQHGDVQNVLETVRKLCSRDIYIDASDSLLLQRSIINLLTIASQHQIPITRLWLIDCFSSISVPSKEIHLSSGLCMPVIKTLQQLAIKGRTMRKLIKPNEIRDILLYASTCQTLNYLRFYGCMLPQCIENEALSTFKARNIKVMWKPLDIFHESLLHLNLKSGFWQSGGTGDVMTEEMYNKELEVFKSFPDFTQDE